MDGGHTSQSAFADGPRDNAAWPQADHLRRHHTIAVTLGSGATQTTWADVRSFPWPDLATLLTTHAVGPKDGPCLVPATFSGQRRRKQDAQRIDVALLDSDAGATMDEIRDAITERGWRATIASTHSHLTCHTRAKRGAYEGWCTRQGVSPDAADAPELFLIEDRGLRPEIAAGASIAAQDDIHVTFEHQPCPRYRVALPLARPWVANAYATPKEATQAWEDAYAALAAALRLRHDVSCADVSRLFYLPRYPADGAAPECALLEGSQVDIFGLPEPIPEVLRNARQRQGSGGKDRTQPSPGRKRASRPASDPGGDTTFTDPDTGEVIDLRRWAAREGKHFLLATALRARSPRVLRTQSPGSQRQHITCPNADAHTSPDADMATFVCDAGQGESEGQGQGDKSDGFVIHCRHAHCTGHDRLVFLRQMLEQRWLAIGDLTHAPYLAESTTRELAIGSDAEMAERVAQELSERFGSIIHDEAKVWRYTGQQWVAIHDDILWRAVFLYDGATFKTPAGEPANVKLNRSRTESILSCMGALLRHRQFFAGAPRGINCASGFITFDATGQPSLLPHNRDHRQRHVLPGQWQAATDAPIDPGSLLHRLLHGCFKDDADRAAKIDLLAEVAGAAATGMATRLIEPKAIVCVGKLAENGKSQVLAALRALLPKDAVSAISPGKFDDRTFVCHLAGKLLNAPDELGGTDAIVSDTFKQLITGDPTRTRDVYQASFEFEPVAQHIFATNVLPPFKGGMDRGVRRRLMVLTFNRVIPREDRLDRIGTRIGEEEADLLLAWAVRGASRVIQRRSFTIPPSSAEALQDWMYSSDTVLAWLDSDEVEISTVGVQLRTAVSVAHRHFVGWAAEQGFGRERLPAVNGFSQRVEAAGHGVSKTRTSAGAHFVGLACIGPDRGHDHVGRR